MLIAQNTSKVPKHNYTYAPLKAKAGSWYLGILLRLDGTVFEQPSWLVLVEGLRCLTYLQEPSHSAIFELNFFKQNVRQRSVAFPKNRGNFGNFRYIYIYIQYTYVWYFHILLCYFLRFFGFLLAEKLHTVSTVAPTILVRSSVLQTWPSVRDPILRADEGRLDPWI